MALPVSDAGGGGGGGLTDAELRAAPVQVELPPGGSGLTDAELRATPVPVSGSLTDAQLRATPVPVSGALTDAELRATPVPVTLSSDWPVPVLFTDPIQLDAATLFALETTELGAATLAALETIGLDAATLAALENVTVNAPVGTPVFVRLSDGAAALVGQKTMALSLPVVVASDQSAIPVSMAAAAVIFKGRAATFRTPGRAGTVGQKTLSLHNAGASPVTVTVNIIIVDMVQTVVKAITVLPPLIRCWKVTVVPTNGTILAKTKIGGSGASDANVVVRGDASADATGSATTLTATLPAGTFITQHFAPRFITAAGYEPADRIEFFGSGETVELLPGEGIVLFLDYVLATQNPVTDMWIAGIEWSEN